MDPPVVEFGFDSNRGGARYASYPTADRFTDAFTARAYAAWAARRNLAGAPRPLSLYVHLPFCGSPGCARHAGKAAKYLRYLRREVALQAALFADDARVARMHWGGGTPAHYGVDALEALYRAIASHFELARDLECSIEVGPRHGTPEAMRRLRETGFNRIRLGVRDFDPGVRQAANRVRHESEIRALVEAARDCGFASVTVDLIYGLPFENESTFAATIEGVAAMAPERVALHGQPRISRRYAARRKIADDTLRAPQRTLALLELAVDRLVAAGYIHIGMDHFALPGDALALAQRQGRLHRDFLGYSTHAECDVVGLGVSAIGAIGPSYSQNARTLASYYGALDLNQVPVTRGVELSRDDLVRCSVMRALMCDFAVSKDAVGAAYLIDFDAYFAPELEALRAFEREGLIETGGEWIAVTRKGRLLTRRMCMVFDRYLRENPPTLAHSGAIRSS